LFGATQKFDWFAILGNSNSESKAFEKNKAPCPFDYLSAV